MSHDIVHYKGYYIEIAHHATMVYTGRVSELLIFECGSTRKNAIKACKRSIDNLTR
jgi:hypothetical protein